MLGCTHYPLLTGLLSVVMGDSVTLVSSAEETAKDVYRVLTEPTCCGPTTRTGAQSHVSSATGASEPFTRLRHRFLGPDFAVVAPAYGGVR